MTTEATARLILATDPMLDAQSWSDFLTHHPDFLATHCATELTGVLQALVLHHPDLFAELTLPQPPVGVASLPHTQLRLWREKLSRLNFAMDTLRTTAEANATLDRVLHEFACALLRAPQHTAEQVVTLLHQHFAVDNAQLIAVETLNHSTQRLLEGWLASRTPLCGRLSEAQRQALFGTELPDTGSAALIAIGSNLAQPRWILALGRITPDGFNPSQGTLFLTQIGELVSAFLSDERTIAP
jgi:uncharacterized protein YigA (DUF484 family)